MKSHNFNDWNEFTAQTKNINVTDLNSKYIIKALGSCLQEFYGYNNKLRPQRTTLIKDTLTNLGDKKLKGKPKYKVYSNGISQHLRQSNGGQFKSREWLYDLQWYTEGIESYTLKTLPLVVECEWSSKRKEDRSSFSGIKYDFHKLLITNAELRLMIFLLKRNHNLSEIDSYFDYAIECYKNIETNSKFLFVAFDKNINGFYYSEKRKKN